MFSVYGSTLHDIFDNDKKIVKKLAEKDNSSKLLNILKQIPNLDINLSPLQESVVTSNDNLLCLGRSGTGKTTSSVLRLFSQEIMFMLFRKRAELNNLKKSNPQMELPKLRLHSSDLQKACGMKTVFISASPVLVNEVSRFYTRLKEALILTL